ncbi:MAG: UvrD-helicase domain-containing protein [Sandaracinaceae bacterium]|nr:UvrD-helicase domain-containing protein [Sandaracinaceae bacterium]
MARKRQIMIKPSCAEEIRAFPSNRTAVLWEKINSLIDDPTSGPGKTQLKGTKDVYRLKVGEYRIFYRFGPDWVSLLGLRIRNERTYEAIPEAEALPAIDDGEDDLDEILAAAQPKTFELRAAPDAEPLPRPITSEWLATLGVAPGHALRLVECTTEEELLSAQVPGDVLARVVDALFPPSLEQVVQQPDLLVASTTDLVRYKEGDLLAFLLRLDEEQAKLTRWALQGPTMVRGGAGTGKSTVALYRVAEVLARAGATGRETVLFTTYTNALMSVTRQLLQQLLTPEQFARVRVATCDRVAREIVATRRKVGSPESGPVATKRLRELRARHVPSAPDEFQRAVRERGLARLSDRYLLEEIEWIVEGRGLSSLADYLEAPRPGRGLSLTAGLREAVWEIAERFRAERVERYAALRGEALEIVRGGAWTRHFDYVFVDEAQDLSPSALALMAEVCRTPEGLFFAADSKQSLYSRNYTWSSAHPRLQFKGRTAILKRNYRSTREIDRAAFAVLEVEPEETLEPSTSVHDGPLPVLLSGATDETEPVWIGRFVREMSRHLHLPTSAAAVLVPTAKVGREIADALARDGLDARFFAGKDLDLRQSTVKVLTLHSAKGLEFPIVAVCGFHPGTYPVKREFDDEGLFLERMRNERRLLYVALTRAMRGLLLSIPGGCEHEALTGLDPSGWHLETVA